LLGVAIEDDIYKDARQQIEQELAHREAVEAAARILDEILDGVRTPERARSPVDAYITVRRVTNRIRNDLITIIIVKNLIIIVIVFVIIIMVIIFV